MSHLKLAALLIVAFAVIALVWDAVLYWPAGILSSQPAVQRLFMLALVFLPVVGIWKQRRWGWESALLVTFWFAMHAGAWTGVIAIRTTLDRDPYTLGDWIPHVVVFIALSCALALLVTRSARSAVRSWTKDSGNT